MIVLKNKHKKIISEYVENNLRHLSSDDRKVILNFDFIKNDDSIYFYYPILFKPYFEQVSSGKLNLLCIAGYFLYRYALTMDSITDDKNNNLLEAKLFYSECLNILNSLFKKDSIFWVIYNKRKLEFKKISKIQFSKKKVKINEYEKIASGKSVFGKIAIDALYYLSEKRTSVKIYEGLLKSHDMFSTGVQILDDIIDVKEDLSNNQINYLINFYMPMDSSVILNYSSFINLLYVKGIIEKTLRLAKQYFQKSKEIILYPKNKSLWIDQINNRIFSTNEKLNKLTQYLDKHKSIILCFKKSFVNKIHRFSPNLPLNELVYSLFRFVVYDFENNNTLTDHEMYLSTYDGFYESKIHRGSIFTRTLVLNNLYDYYKKTNLTNKDMIKNLVERHLKYLLVNRNNGLVGGWKYFPNLKELSVDIDDLAEVGRFFYNYNFKNEIRKYICPVVEVINTSCMCKEQKVPKTWVIPPSSHPYYLKQNKMNKKWGEGPDVEVVANYLLMLAKNDSMKFSEQIKDGLLYFNNTIRNGYWTSRWYHGDFYGTYIVTSFFKSSNSIDFNLKKHIASFITNKQLDNGSWAIANNEKGDILSTSLALLILYNIESLNRKTISKGLNYLKNNIISLKSQTPNFIIPKTGSSFKSFTVTASYCIKAISLIGDKKLFNEY